MPKPDAKKAEQQETAVSAFIEEHRPILEDSEAGYSALSRVYTGGADLLSVVNSHSVEVANLTTDAANRLTAAINDPHCPAGKLNEREKEYARLKAETKRLATAFGRLDAFLGDVKAQLDTEFDEKGVRTKSVVEAEEAPSVVPDHPTPPERLSSWFRRIFGSRKDREEAAEKPEPPEPARAVPTAESDRENYEKLLVWYEQNLEVLEKAVVTRQAHKAAYASNAEMLERWKATYDSLNGRIEQAEKAMDTLEQRNLTWASGRFRDLLTRRMNLAARRSELKISA